MENHKIIELIKAIRDREKINRDIQLDLLIDSEDKEYRKGEYMYSLGKYDLICEILEKLGE